MDTINHMKVTKVTCGVTSDWLSLRVQTTRVAKRCRITTTADRGLTSHDSWMFA